MVLAAVHDVGEPAADLERVVAALAGGAHGGADVLAVMADEGDGADEELEGTVSLTGFTTRADRRTEDRGTERWNDGGK